MKNDQYIKISVLRLRKEKKYRKNGRVGSYAHTMTVTESSTTTDRAYLVSLSLGPLKN